MGRAAGHWTRAEGTVAFYILAALTCRAHRPKERHKAHLERERERSARPGSRSVLSTTSAHSSSSSSFSLTHSLDLVLSRSLFSSLPLVPGPTCTSTTSFPFSFSVSLPLCPFSISLEMSWSSLVEFVGNPTRLVCVCVHISSSSRPLVPSSMKYLRTSDQKRCCPSSAHQTSVSSSSSSFCSSLLRSARFSSKNEIEMDTARRREKE